MASVVPIQKQDDCMQYAASQCSAFAAAGAAVGLFQAHFNFRDLPIKMKMDRWGSLVRTTSMVAKPLGYFTAIGFTFSATECLVGKMRGKEDAYNSMLAGLAAGAIVGARKGTAPATVGYSLLFAGGAAVSEFFGRTAHHAFDDVKSYGPVEKASTA